MSHKQRINSYKHSIGAFLLNFLQISVECKPSCKNVTINIIRDLDSIFGKRLEVKEGMKTVLWKYHLTTDKFYQHTYILHLMETWVTRVIGT